MVSSDHDYERHSDLLSSKKWLQLSTDADDHTLTPTSELEESRHKVKFFTPINNAYHNTNSL